MRPTENAEDMVKAIRRDHPSLLKYDLSAFKVLRILTPVPPEMVNPAYTPTVAKVQTQGRDVPLSLNIILEQLRERSEEAKETELINDYVQVIPNYLRLDNYFKNEDGEFISVILVRFATSGERAERGIDRKKRLKPGITFRLQNLLNIIHQSSPSDRLASSVALFDRNLALLQYKLENLDILHGSDKAALLFPEEQDFHGKADEFISAAIGEDRLYALKPFLEVVFGDNLELQYKGARIYKSETLSVTEKALETQFDGVYLTKIKLGGRSTTRVILDVKTTRDALSRLTKSYAEEVYGFKDEPYFESTYFPKVFIALNAHKLEIYTAVTLKTVVVNEILSLDMRGNHSRSELTQNLARVAVALRECSTQLNTYYSELKRIETPLSYFPAPTPEPSDVPEPLQDTLKGLQIIDHLGWDEISMGPVDQPSPAGMRHNLFLANYVDADKTLPVRAIVKITRQYGAKAHTCLAERNLAPRLILCQPVIGNLLLVVMEHAPGEPLDLMASKLNALQKRLVFDKLKEVIRVLADNGLVHGDLRAPNILVHCDELESNPPEVTVNIIDFDWAAEYGEGCYPEDINMEELHKQWHRDVGPKEKMRTAHDKFAVLNVLGRDLLDIGDED